jgi:hypothetical protein
VPRRQGRSEKVFSQAAQGIDVSPAGARHRQIEVL